MTIEDKYNNVLSKHIKYTPDGPWIEKKLSFDNPWKDLSADDLLTICMAFDLSMEQAHQIETFIKKKQEK